MSETLLNAFATLFVVIDPPGLLPVFLGLTAGASAGERRKIAFLSIGVGAIVLIAFAFLGDSLLGALGISMPAFRIAGGIFLFLIALEMLFEKRTERRSKSATEVAHEGAPASDGHDDVAIFPLAVPLIAGPGAIATIILLVGGSERALADQFAVVGIMVFVLAITLAMFLVADPLERIVGERVTKIITRLLGIILGALAVQFVISGIAGIPFVLGN